MINVDPVELQKFSELAHRWWDPHSEFKPLHDINPLRLGYIDQIAGLKGKRVLDVGCGGGILSEAMSAAGARVTGIDVGDKPLKVAQMHLLESGLEVEYRNITVEELADKRLGEFDVITCMEMLEHVPDPASAINACARLVNPGGRCFFSTINRNPKSYLFAILGAEYVLNLLPRGTHDYARFITPAELASYCRRAELQTEHLIGMSYNPFTKIYSLVADTSVNYILSARAI
ncbi:MAG: bifunctional 2-polyprenyl-6-hydroxyphenol methylase/3-demethylubiquinol 3-O-methyltransferase UbiG [Betaproteobacteria bacterium]|nr:bifunctional 2-polyprenyl-6-hydroxyphenol methylase/3-demethylubiquinol 3-O-methyltransferase UbiG [Betaproteobacteria bacterium]